MATASVKYFSGDTLLKSPFPVDNKKFAAAFGALRGKRNDSFTKWVGIPADGPPAVMPVTRVIFFKSNPSLHKCDARCTNAKGHNCECSCGGKNHGAGG
jgi:hypothetical protein